MLDSIPSDHPVSIMIRHAERDSIDDVSDTITAHLNAAGRAAARELGSSLARFAPLRLFHSPVPRCGHTAELLAEGAAAAGARAEVVDALADLGGPYMRDWNKVMERVLKQGVGRFVQEWFGGRLEPGLANDPVDSARRQLMVLVDQLLDHTWTGCTVNVTHDWNVLLVRRYYCGLGVAEAGWPDFLEGVVASRSDDGLDLRHGEIVRRWPLPLPKET